MPRASSLNPFNKLFSYNPSVTYTSIIYLYPHKYNIPQVENPPHFYLPKNLTTQKKGVQGEKRAIRDMQQKTLLSSSFPSNWPFYSDHWFFDRPFWCYRCGVKWSGCFFPTNGPVREEGDRRARGRKLVVSILMKLSELDEDIRKNEEMRFKVEDILD
jgi:hypothetical protein